MLDENATSSEEGKRFTVIRGGGRRVSDVLLNMMRDTSAPTLIYLAERYGLRRVPGLNQGDLIMRIINSLSTEELDKLGQELIAARYGGLSVDELLELVLHYDEQRQGRAGKARLDEVSPERAILIESSPGEWAYTLRGYDVRINLAERRLGCDCQYFRFAAHRQGLCKHLAAAFRLMPVIYARRALIDLIVSREYGNDQGGNWHFGGPHAA